jgi:protoporphyrinogen/coproporphyrinogen III oxidase
MSEVTVIGGGFSGLSTAYYLARGGVAVTLLEKQDRLGGLIGTLQTEHGPVELAASGIRSSARVESLFHDLDLPIVTTKKESNARYLFRNRPRRWPLGPIDSLQLGGRLAGSLVTGRFRPYPAETIDAWATRVLGSGASHYIVGAALQGIYAGDPKRLSAPLIFGKKEKPAKGKVRGLVAPPGGLGQLIDALEQRLLKLGVTIRRNVLATEDIEGTVVVCTSAKDAAGLIAKRAPQTADALGKIEMLPLVRVTAFYPASENTIGGFGILFPRGQEVSALGVLFNTNIFPGRGAVHSESWILGGAEQPEVVDFDDEALFAQVARDRQRVYGRAAKALAMFPQRWPVALPHYDVEFERLAGRGFPTPPNTFLAGNYLRGIGLPMLLERAFDVAQQVRPSR